MSTLTDEDFLLFGKQTRSAARADAIKKASMLSINKEGVGGGIDGGGNLYIERSDSNRISVSEKNFEDLKPEDEKNFAKNFVEKISEKNSAVKIPEDSTELDSMIPQWREQILTLAQGGLSECEIKVELCTINGIFSPKQWSLLKENIDVAGEMFEIAQSISQSWWLSQGRRSLLHDSDTKFETALWISCMKNMFGWSEKNESAQTQNSGQSVMAQARVKYMERETRERSITLTPNKKTKKMKALPDD